MIMMIMMIMMMMMMMMMMIMIMIMMMMRVMMMIMLELTLTQRIFLMNRQDNRFPHHGAVTDVNVWSRVLTEQEVSDWQHCRRDLEDPLLAWHSAQLNVYKLNISKIERRHTCLKPVPVETDYVGYSIQRSFHSTKRLCASIGGEIALSRDEESFSRISGLVERNLSRVSPHECLRLIWSGHEKEDGVWREGGGQVMTWQDWEGGFPVDRPRYDCIQQDLETGRILKDNDNNNKNNSGKIRNAYCSWSAKLSWPICPVCQLGREKRNFVLEGVCVESSVDAMFVMIGPTEFLGYISSRMTYSVERDRWEILNSSDTAQVLAFMKGRDSRRDFPIGVNRWTFLDTTCTDPGLKERSLSLHQDLQDQFWCGDGTWTPSQRVCDDFSDCHDGSDERNCSFLNLRPRTGIINGPPTIRKRSKYQPIVLNATFIVLDVFEISQIDFSFDLHFILEIQWFDEHLNFEYLKNDDHDNVVPESLRLEIWTPTVEFSKVKRDSTSSFNDRLIVLKRDLPSRDADLDSVNAREVYSGRHNPLKIFLERRKEFSCSFDNIKNFPFGQQNCFLQFQLVGVNNKVSTEVVGDVLVVGQYLVSNWTVSQERSTRTGRIMTRITMVLSRKMISIFMVTYLPTILINMINQATNYIPGVTKYDMIYTINVTCMMVLASIYLSISSSLPVTADIKPVEVWLIFNLAYPFLTILVNIVLQVEINIYRIMTWVSS